jgi:hypothetical protein
MMVFPERLKKELVLWFKFRRVSTNWKREHECPGVIRIAAQDCRQEYQEPKLVGNIDDGFVEVRIYDDQGINIANGPKLIGDWSHAVKRCEDFLESEIKRTPGHAKDAVHRVS